jgi:hypothetical protein
LYWEFDSLTIEIVLLINFSEVFKVSTQAVLQAVVDLANALIDAALQALNRTPWARFQTPERVLQTIHKPDGEWPIQISPPQKRNSALVFSIKSHRFQDIPIDWPCLMVLTEHSRLEALLSKSEPELEHFSRILASIANNTAFVGKY